MILSAKFFKDEKMKMIKVFLDSEEFDENSFSVEIYELPKLAEPDREVLQNVTDYNLKIFHENHLSSALESEISQKFIGVAKISKEKSTEEIRSWNPKKDIGDIESSFHSTLRKNKKLGIVNDFFLDESKGLISSKSENLRIALLSLERYVRESSRIVSKKIEKIIAVARVNDSVSRVIIYISDRSSGIPRECVILEEDQKTQTSSKSQIKKLPDVIRKKRKIEARIHAEIRSDGNYITAHCNDEFAVVKSRIGKKQKIEIAKSKGGNLSFLDENTKSGMSYEYSIISRGECLATFQEKWRKIKNNMKISGTRKSQDSIVINFEIGEKDVERIIRSLSSDDKLQYSDLMQKYREGIFSYGARVESRSLSKRINMKKVENDKWELVIDRYPKEMIKIEPFVIQANDIDVMSKNERELSRFVKNRTTEVSSDIDTFVVGNRRSSNRIDSLERRMTGDIFYYDNTEQEEKKSFIETATHYNFGNSKDLLGVLIFEKISCKPKDWILYQHDLKIDKNSNNFIVPIYSNGKISLLGVE